MQQQCGKMFRKRVMTRLVVDKSTDHDKPHFNRPFPSSLVPLFQSESKCETVLMKMSLICMKMKLHAELIFVRMVSHLDSLWNRGTRELGNGLFVCNHTINVKENVFFLDRQLRKALRDTLKRTAWKQLLSNFWLVRSEHTHASYPGLSFRPPGFSSYIGREERRVQGLV